MKEDKILAEKLLKVFGMEIGDLPAFPDQATDLVDLIITIGSARVKQQIKDVEKAYGGCRLCYGKGYATELVQNEINVEHPDVRLIPCACERGRELRKYL